MSFVAWSLFWLILAGLTVDAIHGYAKGTGSMWDKMLSMGKSSASILAARVGAIGGLGLQGIVEIADVVATPGVKAFVDQYINAPAVGWTMVACALVAEIARRRTLSAPLVGVGLDK